MMRGLSSRTASYPSPRRSIAPGAEILDEDVGASRHVLDERQSPGRLEIDRDRFLVGVEQQEVPGILPRLAAEGGAAGIAAVGVFDLHHFGAEPGQCFGARGTGLELREV
jgi:hypothetical protein